MAHQDVYPPWKIVRRLGAGSLTEAFLVEGPSGAAVLKRLLPFFLSNEALCTAFVLKAEESKALSHPNIVKVLETGAHGRDRYAVMEHVEGRALSRAAARMTEKGWAALPHDCVSAVGVAAADALQFAHGQGVLHLDVTLHNLYLGPDGALKLADFGLAHTRRSTTTEQGSRELLPPELRLEDPASASPAADVWALGLCLYRLAGGVVPVNAEQNALPKLSTCVKGVDPSFESVVEKLLAADPADRYSSAAEASAALSGLLGGRDAVALRKLLFAQLFSDGAPADPSFVVPVSTAISDEPTPAHGMAALGAKRFPRPWHIAAGAFAFMLLVLYLLLPNAPAGLMQDEPQSPVAVALPRSVDPVPGPTGKAEPLHLPRSTSSVPATFIVTSDRHGFFLEADKEQQPLPPLDANVPHKVWIAEQRRFEPEYYGRIIGLALTTHGRVLFPLKTEPQPLPPGTVTPHFLLLGDLDNDREISVELRPRVQPVRFTSESPSVSLQDDEAFTLDGLDRKKTYEVRVKALAGDSGLLVERFDWDEIGQSYTPNGQPVSNKVVKGAELLYDGQLYLLKDARRAQFAMARSYAGEPVSSYEVKVTEIPK